MRFAARYLFFLVLFIVATAFFFVTHASAQSYPQSYSNLNVDPNVRQDYGSYVQVALLNILDAGVCQITGIESLHKDQGCLGYDPTTGKIGYMQKNGGAISALSFMIGSMYNPPVRAGEYFQYVAGNFGIVKSALADGPTNGFGYDRLSPLLKLWVTMRNIAYLFFVVVFILIGFGIMFRFKIDPRTVMTIENQIPKIIIALLLVTFSFAIAALLVDLMYVATYLIFSIFASSYADNKTLVDQIHHTESTFNGDNPLGVMNNLVGFRDIVMNAAGSVKDIVQNLLFVDVTDQTGKHGDIFIISGIIDFFATAFDVIRNAFGWVLGILAALLAMFIFAFAVLIAMFRLWFALLGAYVYILLDVALAPFYIMLGVLPGSKVGFGQWVRNLVANLSAFPVTIGMFLMARIFMESFTGNANGIFVPPLIGNPQPGGSGQQSPVGSLIALGFILLTPQVVAITKDLFKASSLKQTAGIAQTLGAGAGQFMGIVKGATSTAHSAEEYIIKSADKNGKVTYGHRGIGRAVLNRFTGGGH